MNSGTNRGGYQPQGPAIPPTPPAGMASSVLPPGYTPPSPDALVRAVREVSAELARLQQRVQAERRAHRFLAGVLMVGGGFTTLTAIWAQDWHGVVLFAGTVVVGAVLWRRA